MTRWLALIAMLAGFGVSRPLSAQPVDWQAVGPFGAPATGLEMDRQGTLWANTHFGIFKLEDATEPWMLTDLDELYEEIVEGPDGIWYAHDSGVGFYYQSRDQGQTWEELLVTYVDPETDEALAFSALELVVDGEHGLLYVAVRNRVLRSADAGHTWASAGEEFDGYIFDLLLAPGSDLYAVAGYRLYRSNDQGETWQNIHRAELPSNVVRLHQTSTGALLAFTLDHGIYRQPERSALWEQVSGLHGQQFVADEAGVLYLVSDLITGDNRYERHLYRSQDDGRSWAHIRIGNHPQFVWDIEVGSDGILYAGTGRGVFRSRTRGDSWQHLTDGMLGISVGRLLRGPEGAIWATTSAGTFMTTSKGEAWEAIDVAGRLVALDEAGTLYAYSDTTLYRSLDDGLTWHELARLALPYYVDSFSITSLSTSGDGTIMAVSFAQHLHDFFRFVHVSHDGGATWTTQDFPWALTGFAAPTGDLFVGGPGRIARSTDRGVTWTTVATLDGRLYLRGFAAAANGDLYAGAYNTDDPATYLVSGLYRSTDQGATWTQVDLGSGAGSIKALASWAGQVLALTFDGRIYRTSGGEVELVAEVGEEVPEVNTFTFGADGTVYLGTATRGVYRSDRPLATTIENRPGEMLETIVLEESYPNPFAQSTRVRFRLAQAVDVHLDVVDVLGRTVGVLVEQVLPAGQHTLVWEASGASAGVYFLRLRADGRVHTRTVILLR